MKTFATAQNYTTGFFSIRDVYYKLILVNFVCNNGKALRKIKFGKKIIGKM